MTVNHHRFATCRLFSLAAPSYKAKYELWSEEFSIYFWQERHQKIKKGGIEYAKILHPFRYVKMMAQET
jgi:hypothetical protein